MPHEKLCEIIVALPMLSLLLFIDDWDQFVCPPTFSWASPMALPFGVLRVREMKGILRICSPFRSAKMSIGISPKISEAASFEMILIQQDRADHPGFVRRILFVVFK